MINRTCTCLTSCSRRACTRIKNAAIVKAVESIDAIDRDQIAAIERNRIAAHGGDVSGSIPINAGIVTCINQRTNSDRLPGYSQTAAGCAVAVGAGSGCCGVAHHAIKGSRGELTDKLKNVVFRAYTHRLNC